MDLDLARTFVAVVETGSFVRAAERVHVTQSTVSMRIKSLEEQRGYGTTVKPSRWAAVASRSSRHTKPNAGSSSAATSVAAS
jgi:DNA-binding Lrp family transcriptional regulator